MSSLRRYSLEGKYSFVGTGMVKDHYTGEVHEGKLIFNAFSPAIETKDESGRREARLNLDLVKNAESGSMWEIVIMDGETENNTDQEIVIDDEELVAFISDGIMQMDRNLTKNEMILAVLDLEFEFLKSKGLIGE